MSARNRSLTARVERFKRTAMRLALTRAKGSVAGAAQRLGITVRQMRHGAKRYGLAVVDAREFNSGGDRHLEILPQFLAYHRRMSP